MKYRNSIYFRNSIYLVLFSAVLILVGWLGVILFRAGTTTLERQEALRKREVVSNPLQEGRVGELRYKVIEIGYCEYIQYYVVTSETRIIHKADCDNPIHKENN